MLTQRPAVFIADAKGLDFLNSLFTPVDVQIDALDNGEGFVSWLDQAGLAPTEILAHFEAHAVPGELDGVAAQARSLREWFRAFVVGRMGKSLTSTDLKALEPLNRLLARDEAFRKIVAHGDGEHAVFALQSKRRWRAPESLLLPIAEELARFVCDEDFAKVKACEGEACTLIFVDHTRGRQRRWCSMSVCGNRHKQAAHRRRSKGQTNR